MTVLDQVCVALGDRDGILREAISSPRWLGWYANKWHKQVTHLVPDISGFDAGEDVTTVCGIVVSGASNVPNFDLCDDCVRGAE